MKTGSQTLPRCFFLLEKLLFIWNCWAEIIPQWTEIVISPVRNISLKIWDLLFELMKKETKLQQKLFDKRTLTWKNENHVKNEQNRIKAILRIFDFVNNPIQFDFIFFCDFVLYWSWSKLFDFKGSSITYVLPLVKFRTGVSFSYIFIIDYVHIWYNQKSLNWLKKCSEF